VIDAQTAVARPIPVQFAWPERRAAQLSIAQLDAAMDLAIAGPGSVAGIQVTPDSAMRLATVFAVVRVLAESVASLPFITYKKLADGGKERATDHPLYDLLRYEPNPETTALEFWETAMGHLLLWGNFYAQIERNGYGVVALWPLRPDRMAVARLDDQVIYVYREPNGQTTGFRFDEIFHVRGLSFDGLTGVSPIAYARESIGLALAAEAYGARFFANDSRPGGLLSYAGKMNKEAKDRLREAWAEMQSGANRGKVGVLDDGWSWQQIGVPPEDAQFLETRKYQRTDICAIFRVPPHKVGDLERATFSNIEHQSIEFVTDSLRPWLVRIEQAVRRDLFRITAGKRSHFAEFLVDALLRGDAMSRSQALAIQRQNGVITANEWREVENRNRVEGGDDLLVNGAMTPLDQVGAPPPPPPAPALPAPPPGDGQQEGR
jgi:HK97 family phage portal protein